MSVRIVGYGLVKVTGTAAMHCGLWQHCKARKATKCRLSGRPILVGDMIYRPITNGSERMTRILAESHGKTRHER